MKTLKTKRKMITEEKAFSLVELMVVVSIIGILSAVAIPNFQKYQAKSKSSEAKIQLAAAYTAVSTLMSDYDSYGSCMDVAGYSGPGQNNYYAIGFNSHESIPNDTILNNGGTGCVTTSTRAYPANRRVKNKATAIGDLGSMKIVTKLGANYDYTHDEPKVSVDGASFAIGAIGYIDSKNADTIDDASQWAINHNKDLRMVVRGY